MNFSLKTPPIRSLLRIVLLFHLFEFFGRHLAFLDKDGRTLEEMLLQLVDETFGSKFLLGVVSRALLLAAAAFGAGICVEELFPAKLLHSIDAEGFSLFVFEVHLVDDARGAEVPKVDVRNRAKQVKVFRSRNK